MGRIAPILFILAALIVAVVLLFGGGDTAEDDFTVDDDVWEKEDAPELRTSDAARPGTRRPSATSDDTTAAPAPPRGRTRYIQGRVVDAVTGKPIAGARLFAEHSYRDADCARLPHALRVATGSAERSPADPDLERGRVDIGGAVTDADGAFAWWVGDVRKLSGAPFDVFASAPGYVTGIACEVAVGDEPTIRLRKAVELEIEVTDPQGRPIEGARVVLASTRLAIAFDPMGTAGVAMTDENGRAVIGGLRPAAEDETGAAAGKVSMLRVDHPAWMPATSPPFHPALASRQHVKLLPALRLTMKIRSDDGTAVKNPTLAYKTDGAPPHEHLSLLFVTSNGPEGEPEAEVVSKPVRLPCDHAFVVLQVKADGFSEWIQKEPLPAEGGERELIVILTRDTGLGGLELRYQDPDGSLVPYTKLSPGPPEITNLDGVEVGTITMEQGEALSFKSLPPGRYLVTKRSAAYAPASIEVEVRGGEVVKETVKLAPPAKLRVRFVSDAQHVVEFRLLQDRRILPAYPVSEDGRVPAEAPGTGGRLSAPGGEGTLFTGLPPGRVTIEVTSTDLVAAPRTVNLEENETTEIEIEVRAR